MIITVIGSTGTIGSELVAICSATQAMKCASRAIDQHELALARCP